MLTLLEPLQWLKKRLSQDRAAFGDQAEQVVQLAQHQPGRQIIPRPRTPASQKHSSLDSMGAHTTAGAASWSHPAATWCSGVAIVTTSSKTQTTQR